MGNSTEAFEGHNENLVLTVNCEARYLRWAIEGVGVQDRLDHDEGLGQVLPVEMVSVIGTLIRTVVEHLQERGAPQMEHELERRWEKNNI